MRVVVDYDVDRLQVYNGDIKPSSTNCPRSFSKKTFFELCFSLEKSFYINNVNPLELGWLLRGLSFQLSTFNSQLYLGGYSAEVPSLPIPNRVIKLSNADGTAIVGE